MPDSIIFALKQALWLDPTVFSAGEKGERGSPLTPQSFKGGGLLGRIGQVMASHPLLNMSWLGGGVKLPRVMPAEGGWGRRAAGITISLSPHCLQLGWEDNHMAGVMSQ